MTDFILQAKARKDPVILVCEEPIDDWLTVLDSRIPHLLEVLVKRALELFITLSMASSSLSRFRLDY